MKLIPLFTIFFIINKQIYAFSRRVHDVKHKTHLHAAIDDFMSKFPEFSEKSSFPEKSVTDNEIDENDIFKKFKNTPSLGGYDMRHEQHENVTLNDEILDNISITMEKMKILKTLEDVRISQHVKLQYIDTSPKYGYNKENGGLYKDWDFEL